MVKNFFGEGAFQECRNNGLDCCLQCGPGRPLPIGPIQRRPVGMSLRGSLRSPSLGKEHLEVVQDADIAQHATDHRAHVAAAGYGCGFVSSLTTQLRRTSR